MRRLLAGFLTVCAVGALGSAAGAAPARAAAGGVTDPPPLVAAPRAQLTNFTCTRALDPANRAVAVQAVMRPVTGTAHLQVKFDLLVQLPGQKGGHAVRAGDLGIWVSPDDPTLGQLPADVWRLDKTVLNLAPATYRFRVTFRWTGTAGQVLATAVRLSSECVQRELRPDLLVRSVTVTPDPQQSGDDVYDATIANAGATGTGPFEVLFAPGDNAPPIIDTISGGLRAGRSRSLSFVAAACDPSDPPTLTVDATDEVDDSDRANNQVTITCPSSGGGSGTPAATD